MDIICSDMKIVLYNISYPSVYLSKALEVIKF
jgi:hypothetical protein